MQNQNHRKIKYYSKRRVKTSTCEAVRNKIRDMINEKGFTSNIVTEEHEIPLLLASRYLANDDNWQPEITDNGEIKFFKGVNKVSWKDGFILGNRPISQKVYQAYSDILGLDNWEELVEYEEYLLPYIPPIRVDFNKAPEAKKILFGHQGCVSSIAIHPDGNIIATGGWDKNIILWDFATGEQIRIFKGHTDQVTQVCFSPCGELLLSSSYDYSLRLWDLRKKTLINTLFRQSFTPVNTTRLCEVVAFSPDGNLIVSAGLNNKVYLWDKLRFFDLPFQTLDCPASIISLVFSPNGYFLAAGCDNGVVRIWKFDHNYPTYEDLESHSEWVTSLTFTPDSQYLFAGLKNGKIRIWDLANTTSVKSELVLHDAPVSALAIHPYETNILVSGDMRGSICLWSWTENRPMYSFPGHNIFTTSLCFTPNGEWLVSGGGDNFVKIWQLS